MRSIVSKIFSAGPLLFAFVLVNQFAYGAYVGAELEMPAGISFLFHLGVLWAIGWWLQTDRRRRDVLAVYDPGFFLYLAWPVVMPYYLLKTRGAKGLLIILGFVVAYVGAPVLGSLVSLVVMALRS